MEISKEEYFKLKRAELKLDLLEAGGVDNWEGYSDSLRPTGEKGFGKLCEELRGQILGGEAYA